MADSKPAPSNRTFAPPERPGGGMDVGSVYFPIGEVNRLRKLPFHDRLCPGELRHQPDWAGVSVDVPVPWLGADPVADTGILPAATAEVIVEKHAETGSGTQPYIHLVVDRNPELRGAAGTVVVTMFDAVEALHLGRLLIRGAEAAILMANQPAGGG